MDAQVVGTKIQGLRKKKRLTQKQLADLLSVSCKAISRWECGAGLPDIAMIPVLAKVFGIDMNDLLEDNRNALKASLSSGDIIRIQIYNKFFIFARVLLTGLHPNGFGGDKKCSYIEVFGTISTKPEYHEEYIAQTYLISPILIHEDSEYEIIDFAPFTNDYFERVTEQYAFNNREVFVDFLGAKRKRIPVFTTPFKISTHMDIHWLIYLRLKHGGVCDISIKEEIIDSEENPQNLYKTMDELIQCSLLEETFFVLLDSEIISQDVYDKAINIYNDYINELKTAAGDPEKIMKAIKEVVEHYNELNEAEKDNMFIETNERETLAALINRGAELAGLEGTCDYTEDWRAW